jgi:putative serine protease PepD
MSETTPSEQNNDNAEGVEVTPADSTPAETTSTEATPPAFFRPAPEELAPAQVAPAVSAPTTESAASPTEIPAAFAAAPAGQPVATVPAEKRRLAFPLVAAVLVAGLLGGAVGAGTVVILRGGNSDSASNASNQAVVINDTANVSTVTAVAAKASPSVVTIQVSGGSTSGSGSGEFISADGYVLTNNHVATLDGATATPTIRVQDNEGNIYKATIVGTDPTVDLAVLKVDSTKTFTPIEWANSDKLNVGDATIAMGAPLGLAGTVTAGIISALNRSIQIASSAVPDTTTQDTTPNQGGSPFDLWNFDFGQGQSGSTQSSAAATISVPVIQTDASINPGNSGGALLDAQGRLIGINVAIASAGGSSSGSGSIGLGFALPSNLAKRVSDEIIATKKATHGLLGARIYDAASKPTSTQVGAAVKEVISGGAADKAGLKVDDVITSFNGVRISDASDLTAQVRAAAGGSKATVTYTRGDTSKTVEVELGTM